MAKNEPIVAPDNFISIVRDFLKDLSVTFPEYIYLWASWTDPKLPDTEIQKLYEYCIRVFPERFFDILYQNDELFTPENSANTFFLPNVDFKVLFNTENVTENTKKALWKYLQLLLFTIVNSIKDKADFGDTMNLFNGIDENELQSKLNETFSSIGDFFKNMEQAAGEAEKEASRENGFEGFNMPNPEELHGHLKGLFEGKIGTLAKELAEEISHDFQDILGETEDINESTSTQEVLKKMLKNPKKIMDLMKTVSGKLDSKMKSGEISKDEIMKEASEWMSKMKDMGGSDQFNEIFKNITKNMGGMGGMGGLASMAGMEGLGGLGNLGKNMRFDTNAYERMTKQESMKQRMRNKLAKRKEQQALMQSKINELKTNSSIVQSSEPNQFVYKIAGEEGVQEKSYIKRDTEKTVEQMMEEIGPIDTPASAPKKNKKKKGKK